MQGKPDHVAASAILSATVEPGALCDLRCPFCPTGNGEIALSKGFLSVERFGLLLERLGAQLKSLTLFNWGEPLLHPGIGDMIRAASRRGVRVAVSTHFSIPSFNARSARALISSGLKKLTVSCDGARQATYEKYRVGGRFSLVMRNIKSLLRAKKRLLSDSPRIVWQFLVHRGNAMDMDAARRKAAELGIPIAFYKLAGIPEALKKQWALDETPAPGGSAGAPGIPAPYDFFCLQTWDMPIIHSDGVVLPCCVVSDSRYGLGNIFQEPLEKIWNKPLIVAMRRYLRAGIKSKRALPCYGCPHDPNRLSPQPARIK
jgi:radical SAM protein with 4Fe4S-binding SPASM domain